MTIPPRVPTLREAQRWAMTTWNRRYVVIAHPDGTYQPLPADAPPHFLDLVAGLLGGRVLSYDELIPHTTADWPELVKA